MYVSSWILIFVGKQTECVFGVKETQQRDTQRNAFFFYLRSSFLSQDLRQSFFLDANLCGVLDKVNIDCKLAVKERDMKLVRDLFWGKLPTCNRLVKTGIVLFFLSSRRWAINCNYTWVIGTMKVVNDIGIMFWQRVWMNLRMNADLDLIFYFKKLASTWNILEKTKS